MFSFFKKSSREAEPLLGKQSPPQQPSEGLIKKLNPNNNSVISNALTTVTELAYLIPFAGISSNFVKGMSVRLNPLLVTSSYVLGNSFMQGIMSKLVTVEDPSHNNILSKLRYFARSLTFGLVDLSARGVLTHEFAHSLMMKQFYGEFGNITIVPNEYFGLCLSGYTNYPKTDLSDMGAKFGEKNSDLLISASGMMGDTTLGIILAIIGNLIPERFQQLRYHLLTMAYMNMASPIQYSLYSYSVDCTNNEGYDPCKLKNNGISPLILILVPLAVAFLIQTSFIIAKSCRKSKSDSKAEEIPDEVVKSSQTSSSLFHHSTSDNDYDKPDDLKNENSNKESDDDKTDDLNNNNNETFKKKLKTTV